MWAERKGKIIYGQDRREGEFIFSSLKKEKVNSSISKHGFNRAIFKKSPLFELAQNNLEEKIFNVLPPPPK